MKGGLKNKIYTFWVKILETSMQSFFKPEEVTSRRLRKLKVVKYDCFMANLGNKRKFLIACRFSFTTETKNYKATTDGRIRSLKYTKN